MDLKAIADYLYQRMYEEMPYEGEYLKTLKHKKTPLHIRDVALNKVIPLGATGNYVVDLGNDRAEMNYPYYHILEDSEVIRKRGRGTTKSKGSQASVEKSKRDYGKSQVISRVGKDGKVHRTLYQEYRKNARGSRSRVGKSTYVYFNEFTGEVSEFNTKSNTYENKHYHYIEKMMTFIPSDIATKFNLKLRRTQIDYGYDDLYNKGLLDLSYDLQNIDIVSRLLGK